MKQNIQQIVDKWKEYIDTVSDWEVLTKNVEPKQTICGPVYELPSPRADLQGTFAIADMRNVEVAEPHYHTNGETEMYFVISGSGLTVVGGREINIKKGSVIITPPDTGHFTIPKENLVLVVINLPKFDQNNNIDLKDKQSNPEVGFDHEQYNKLRS